MRLICDLHSHSGYSGGVGQISLDRIVQGMYLKGIDIFGSGDILHKEWYDHVKSELTEKYSGLYLSKYSENKYFILQTEVIFTVPYIKNSRKLFHVLILFPDFSSVKKTREYIESIDVKNNIGRPFIKFDSVSDINIFIEKVKSIDEFIEIIPAHIMTPQGIYGSNNPVYFMEEILGDAVKYINIVETGLSADPEMLSCIPELDSMNFISNSDCHSPALNRIGRELTRVEVKKMDYTSLIKSLRDREKTFTFEFPPAEGKFFLTGHRKGKVGHENSFCVYSPDFTPENKICPVCNKKLTVGVYEQLIEILKKQDAYERLKENPVKRENFRQIVPLVDVVRESFGVKSITKKVNNIVMDLINIYGSEYMLWEKFNISDVKTVNDDILNGINQVMKGNFSFFPGYDGEYGQLKIGEKISFDKFNIS